MMEFTELVHLIESETGKEFKYFDYRMKTMLSHLQLHSKSVLEIGFGNGLDLIYLAYHYPNTQFTGIEIDRKCFDKLHTWLRVLGLTNITLLEMDIMRYQPLEPFDFILLSNTMHHIPFDNDHQQFSWKKDSFIIFQMYLKSIEKIESFLAKRGVLVICDVFRNNFFNLIPYRISLKLRNVHWKSKPSLSEWLVLLNHFDFKDTYLKFRVPYKLSFLDRGIPIIGNAWIKFKLWYYFPDVIMYSVRE